MTRFPKVSVIIPFYNVEKYIGDCLDSVVNQTLEDIEIICVNDGSTDKSPEIVARYAQDDSRIIAINKENGGVSSARNAGVAVAKGDYIYFLDSDDFIDLNAFEILYGEAYKNNLDVLFFDAVVVFEDKNLEKRFENKKNIKRSIEYNVATSGKEMFCSMVKNNDYTEVVYLQILKRKYYMEKKLSFYNGIIHEDILFSFISIIQANLVKHIKEDLHFRRYRESSIMTEKRSSKNFIGYLVSITNIIKNCFNSKYDENVLCAIQSLIKKYQKHATKIYVNLSEEEKNNIKLNPGSMEQIFFDLLLKNEFLKLRNSTSYKVGKFLTHAPKNFYDLVKFSSKNTAGG